ncbi:MAG: PilZ domain-containing protein [Planctomycetota bacterium]
MPAIPGATGAGDDEAETLVSGADGPGDSAGPSGHAAEPDSARLWLSDQQWLSVLERVERGRDEDDPPRDYAGGQSDATGQRAHERHALAFRCLIRLAPPGRADADHGTYLVHSRNISAGGLGFVHDHELHTGTRCTVALQPAAGRGMILSARVAWCRPILREAEDATTFDVGVQFDQPIDLDPFFTAA